MLEFRQNHLIEEMARRQDDLERRLRRIEAMWEVGRAATFTPLVFQSAQLTVDPNNNFGYYSLIGGMFFVVIFASISGGTGTDGGGISIGGWPSAHNWPGAVGMPQGTIKLWNGTNEWYGFVKYNAQYDVIEGITNLGTAKGTWGQNGSDCDIVLASGCDIGLTAFWNL